MESLTLKWKNDSIGRTGPFAGCLLQHVCQRIVEFRKVSVMVTHRLPHEANMVRGYQALNSRMANSSVLCLALCMDLHSRALCQPFQKDAGAAKKVFNSNRPIK